MYIHCKKYTQGIQHTYIQIHTIYRTLYAENPLKNNSMGDKIFTNTLKCGVLQPHAKENTEVTNVYMTTSTIKHHAVHETRRAVDTTDKQHGTTVQK